MINYRINAENFCELIFYYKDFFTKHKKLGKLWLLKELRP